MVEKFSLQTGYKPAVSFAIQLGRIWNSTKNVESRREGKLRGGGSLGQPVSACTVNPQSTWDIEHGRLFQVENTTGILAIYKVK